MFKFVQLADGLSNLPYSERLKRINLPTLAFRRKRGDMIEMYKHFRFYEKTILDPSFKPKSRPSRKHRFQTHIPPMKDGLNGTHSNFFFSRATKLWNNLPDYVVAAEDINQFKNRIDELWMNDAMKYDYKATTN